MHTSYCGTDMDSRPSLALSKGCLKKELCISILSVSRVLTIKKFFHA